MSTQALSAPISSLSMLLVQTQAARRNAAAPEQLTGAHLYLAESDNFFYGYSGGMVINLLSDPSSWKLSVLYYSA